jgi:D-alanyl-D-alanine carboxypeptidase
MITTAQAIKDFGAPNEKGSYLTSIKLPYPMRLAWDKNSRVTTMRCHQLVAPNFLAVFNELLEVYGYEKIQELGIDLFGGCFNFRQMRGGSAYSRHSWGIAIDLDPERNQLKETSKTARFARSEYKPMIDIFYKHGFLSLGREKNYDWMHFEIKPL